MAALLAVSCSYRLPSVPAGRPGQPTSSTVVAADGSVLAVLHGEQDRRPVPVASVPRVVIDAVLAIEDRRFYERGPLDVKALLRAAKANVESGKVVEGGSTITQQYVKIAVLGSSEQSLRRKTREALLAVQLERTLSKDEILERYLNAVYFGNGAYGVEAAAQRYFGKPVGQVTLPEAALLAGLIRAPVDSDPYRSPHVAILRRAAVLTAMLEVGLISSTDATVAGAAPLGVVSAAATYPAGHFIEDVKQWILDDRRFGATVPEREGLLFGGGLTISTTLDPRLQGLAEAAVNAIVPDPAGPRGSLVAIEPSTGFVRAMVGGPDFFGPDPHAKFNLATAAHRQAGSAFKPLVLAAALEAGVPLSARFPAPSRIQLALPYEQVWEVRNYEEESAGDIDLVEATVHSINTVYAQLILQLGSVQAIEMAHRLGIASPLEPLPSAVLGANDVTPLEMAAAYATFANHGVHVAPALVTEVTTASGQVLYRHHSAPSRVLAASAADAVTSVLEQVIQRGTGVGANIGRPAAGKTGTAQEWHDAWFVGFTPQLATAVWVGFPQAQISMTPPMTPRPITGGTWPAQIWNRFMTPAVEPFPPEPLLTAQTPSPTALIPPPPTVPSVAGLDLSAATGALTSAGYVPQTVRVISDWGPPASVAWQRPPPGTPASPGSTVVVGVPGEPAATSLVPYVVGLPPAEAAAALRDVGLDASISVAAAPAPPLIAAGRVWRQEPTGSVLVPAGTSIALWWYPAPAGPPHMR